MLTVLFIEGLIVIPVWIWLAFMSFRDRNDIDAIERNLKVATFNVIIAAINVAVAVGIIFRT